MASDNLDQVGKYLKNTKDTANYAAKKKRPNRPSVERTRDIFDSEVSFTMKFNVQPKQKSVNLNIEFNKPPPLQECLGAPCQMKCQTFDGLTAGDHELQVDYDYQSGSLAVYVNGATYSSVKYYEIGPAQGTVYVTQLALETNTVTICYTRLCSGYHCATLDAFVSGQPAIEDALGGTLTGYNEYLPPFNTGQTNPANYGYVNTSGPNFRLTDSNVNSPFSLYGQVNQNNAAPRWGVDATVISGPQTCQAYWTFEFPTMRLCSALIAGYGGFGGTESTIDYQNGDFQQPIGSPGGFVELLPVITNTITFRFTRNAPNGGLQYFGGIDYYFLQVFGTFV